jgi:hypothetical protein
LCVNAVFKNYFNFFELTFTFEMSLGGTTGRTHVKAKTQPKTSLPAMENPYPTIGNRQSAIGNRQSAIGCRLSAVGCRLSAVGCRLSAVGCRLSAINSLSYGFDNEQP